MTCQSPRCTPRTWFQFKLGISQFRRNDRYGFDENNYSPIPPVGNAASQQGAAQPTSTPKPVVEADMNTLDPTHNRGKVKIINSFATNWEQVETWGNHLKEEKWRVHMLGVKPSLSPAPKEAQVGHRYDALPVEVCTILGRLPWGCFLHKMQNKVSWYRNVLCTYKNRYEQHHMYLLW